MIKKLYLFLTLYPIILTAQHTISGTFLPAKNFKQVILYKVEPTNMAYITYATLNEEGKFTLELDETIKAGIYRLTYGIPQEEKNFDIIYNAKEDISFEFNLDTLTYKTSKENLLLQDYYAQIDEAELQIANFYKAKDTNKKEYLKLFETLKTIQNKYENLAENTMALSFIKANKPYYPNKLENITTYKENLKNTFFDAVDFNDKTLQSSRFLAQMIFNYVFILHEKAQQPKAIDAISELINDSKIEKNFMQMFWYQTSESKNEGLANYITTNYLLDLAKLDNDKELIEAITVFKAISLNEIAPDFSFELKQDNKTVIKKLSVLDEAENYILFFWSSTCSHCLREIPQLHEFINANTDKNLEVIAIGLEDLPYRWKDETYNYPNFIHVYGEGKWDNEIGNAYGVSATPTYFVLDKDKKIIAKPEGIKELKDYYKVEK